MGTTSHATPLIDRTVTYLAHTFIHTMDRGDRDGKLLDYPKFVETYRKCVVAGKFCFFAGAEPDSDALHISHSLQKAPWNDYEEWCGEQDE